MENNLKVRSFESDNESEVFGYDVFIPIENQNSLNITPYDIGRGSTTESGITARLYAEYNLRSNNTEIKLNKVYDGWTTSHQMYGLSNRTVNAHSGSALGTSLPTKKQRQIVSIILLDLDGICLGVEMVAQEPGLQ